MNLGYMYKNGRGVPQNDQLAYGFYEKAAEGGNSQAMFTVANAYEQGKNGVDQDHEKALFWYTKAACKGHSRAKKSLKLLRTLSRPSQCRGHNGVCSVLLLLPCFFTHSLTTRWLGASLLLGVPPVSLACFYLSAQ